MPSYFQAFSEKIIYQYAIVVGLLALLVVALPASPQHIQAPAQSNNAHKANHGMAANKRGEYVILSVSAQPAAVRSNRHGTKAILGSPYAGTLLTSKSGKAHIRINSLVSYQ